MSPLELRSIITFPLIMSLRSSNGSLMWSRRSTTSRQILWRPPSLVLMMSATPPNGPMYHSQYFSTGWFLQYSMVLWVCMLCWGDSYHIRHLIYVAIGTSSLSWNPIVLDPQCPTCWPSSWWRWQACFDYQYWNLQFDLVQLHYYLRQEPHRF